MNPEENYSKIYADFLKSHLSLSRPLSIVCDCSNGTAGVVLEHFKNVPNLTLTVINITPDPDFSAHGPNPLLKGATDQATKKVLEIKADFGVVYDSDADRAVFLDKEGRQLPSYAVATLLFKHSKSPHICDEIVYQSLHHLKIFSDQELIPSRIGSYFIKQAMKDTGASTAAEDSGHYYFKDFFGLDSGLFSTVTMLNLFSVTPDPFSELTGLENYSLNDKNFQLGTKKWVDILKDIEKWRDSEKASSETRDGITLDFGPSWINVRSSNTEPLVRVTAGSTISREECQKLISKIETLLK